MRPGRRRASRKKPTGRYDAIMVQQGHRQGRAERTRARIIDAAAAAFAERGFDGVSFNEMVRESGLSKGAFYFHFSSKEDLALSAFRAKQEQLLARLAAEPLPAKIADRVRVMLHRRALLLADDPALGCVTRLGSELNLRSAPGSVYASFHDDALVAIAALVAEGQRAGEFRADLDPEGAARVIFAAIVGIDSLSLLTSGGKDLASRNDELTDVLLHGLIGPGGRARVANPVSDKEDHHEHKRSSQSPGPASRGSKPPRPSRQPRH